MSSNKSSDESNDNSDNNVVIVNNKYANDGSFLEMFKQMQKNSNNFNTINSNSSNETIISQTINKQSISNEKAIQNESTIDDKYSDNNEQQLSEDTNQTTHKSVSNNAKNIKRKPKTLKTGLIKKQRNDNSDEEERSGEPTDAWNRYMKEVRKYKEKYGDDNDKNRPLVK